MAGRCGCSGSSCSCQVTAGDGVVVTGVGSVDRPYQIASSPDFRLYMSDNPFFSLAPESGGPLNSRSVFLLNFGDVASILITVPNQGGSLPLPPLGTEVTILINAPGTATLGWAGTVFWYGADLPSTNVSGLYRLVLMDNGSFPFWAGTYLGAEV